MNDAHVAELAAQLGITCEKARRFLTMTRRADEQRRKAGKPSAGDARAVATARGPAAPAKVVFVPAPQSRPLYQRNAATLDAAAAAQYRSAA